jgi:DNA-binding CsgD family transcriptional regulator
MVIAEGQSGWALLQAGQWTEARGAFEEALLTQTSPELLYGLGDAIPYYQDAYNAYRETGDWSGASSACFMLTVTYKCCLGNDAAAFGWLARADTASEQGDGYRMKGWLASMRGYMTSERDHKLGLEYSLRALDMAMETGDRDLELATRADIGVQNMRMGDVEAGMRLIDEAMAGVTAGENKEMITMVIVCCSMLMACESVADIRRASQWLQVAESFIHRFGCTYLYAQCRSVYGNLLAMTGKWPAAEEELLKAIEASAKGQRRLNVAARASLANLRLAQGAIEEAIALLEGLEQESVVWPVLAAIKLGKAEPEAAIALLERFLEQRDAASITAANALHLLVEAQLAAGDMATAKCTLDRLQAVAREQAWPEASARANVATGRVAVFEGDATAALFCFERAVEEFGDLELVLESARARLAAAEVLADLNPDVAAIAANGALSVFQELGAQPDEDAAAALLRSLGVATKPGPRHAGALTKREEEVLRLISAGLSNPEIADRLVISRKTAAHHVSNLLSKLGLRNRAEAVAYAARMGVRRN